MLAAGESHKEMGSEHGEKSQPPTAKENVGTCRYCGRRGELRHSHIISRFICVRLKRMPGSSPKLFRDDDLGDLVQDGDKRYLLCGDCEQEFGRFEKAFNDKFLTPFYAVRNFSARYGDWLPRFCALTLWRSGTALTEDPAAGHTPTEVRDLLARALGRWRAFFAGSAPSCFVNEIHIIPLGNKPDLAQYADGVIEYGLPYSDDVKEAFLVVKLTGLVLVGVLERDIRRRGRGTKVHSREGLFDGTVDFGWPEFLHKYLHGRVKTSQALTTLETPAAP